MRSKVFLSLVTLALLSLIATQCAPATTPMVESTPQVVKETVIVEEPVEVVVTPTAVPGPEVADTIRIDALDEADTDAFVKMVVDPFNEEMGTDIQVERGTYGNQEEWLAAVKAAPGDHCIALYISDFGLYNGANQGLLQPLRLENVPNFSNLADKWEFRELLPGDTTPYGVTTDVGMYTFVYAKDKISERPDSYAPMFDPQYTDRIALRDYGLYRIFQTAAYLGLDPNNLTDEEVDQVFETMAQQQEIARAYWQSSAQLDELLANREVWFADYWLDTITRLDDTGTNRLGQLDLGWWFPEEGGPVWAGGPAIAAGCEDPARKTAEMLFNFLLRPEVYTAYAQFSGWNPTLDTSLFDSEAFFAAAPYRATYRDAVLNTGDLIDIAKIVQHQEEWNERYEEMKLGQ